MLKRDRENDSFLLLPGGAITKWRNKKDWFPHLNTKASQQRFPQHQKHLRGNDSEDRLAKCDQKRVSATSLFSAAFKRHGLLWTQEKFLCFMAAGFEFISVLVQLPVPKQINDINRNYIKRARDNNNLWGSQTFLSVSSYLPRLFDEHHSNLHGRHHVRTAFE